MSIESAIDQYAKQDWWTFDTNGLSELVKLCQVGESAKVNRFLEGRYVLVTLTNLVELYKTPYLLALLPKVFEATAYTGATTQTLPFTRRDLLKAFGFGPGGIDPNPLGLFELTDEFAVGLPAHPPFRQAVKDTDARVQQGYRNKVEQDIGANVHVADIYIHTQWAIDKHIDAILGDGMAAKIPHTLTRTPDIFPSQFCFDFTYSFLYCKDPTAKCYTNDFNDLTLTHAAPICERFYTERRLAYAMNQVKNTPLPSEREVNNRFYKVMRPELTRDERRRLTRGKVRVKHKLLQSTEVYSLPDLRRHLDV